MGVLVKRVKKYRKPDRKMFAPKKRSNAMVFSYNRVIPAVKILVIGGFIGGVIRGCIYIIQVTIFSPQYIITQFTYADESIAIYDLPYIYSTIRQHLSGKNYYITRYRNHNQITHVIQQQFPIVKDIYFGFGGDNTIHTLVVFHEPKLRIQSQNKIYAYHDGQFYEIFSGNTLGMNSHRILLPYYASGAESLQGLFFDINVNDFIASIDTIYDTLPNIIDIAYLPGSKRSRIMLANNQVIYINHKKDIHIQLHTLALLQEYYDQFTSLKEIDLGSMEYNQIIAKR